MQLRDWIDGALAPSTAAVALALLFASAPVRAQDTTGVVTGTVVEAGTERPLVGAQVSIPGTGLGTLTNTAGRYLIPNVPAGEVTVRVDLIGYGTDQRTVTLAPGGTAVVDFALSQQAIALNEIVVTGIPGAARRREVGTSIATVDGPALPVPTVDVASLLQAAAPGVKRLQTTGQVGASGVIRLRGVTSVSQGNTPLIYVDGVRLATGRTPPATIHDGRGSRTSGSPLNAIDPSDIARIEVIKGAAATTLYGTEASAGVIQIFTKRGSTGAPQWSLSVAQGANFWPKVSEVIRSHPTDLDLQQARRTGWVQHYDLSVRGGNEDLTYYLSGNFANDEGIVPTQWSKDYGLNANFTAELYPGLTARFTSIYNHRKTRYVADSNNRHGYLLNVIRVGNGYWPGNRNQDWVLTQKLFGTTDNFISGLRLEYTRGGMQHQLQFGINHLEANNSGILPFGYHLNPKGTIGVRRWRDRVLSAEYTGTWSFDVTENVQATSSWGGQLYDETRHELFASGQDFAGPGQHTISSAARRSSQEEEVRQVNAGVFLQQKLGWRDRLFVIAGLRMDGSSTFGEDYGFQFYPKLSASYVISDAAFWPTEWWNTMRIRAALGMAGKAPGAFDAVRTWDPVSYQGQPAVTPDNLGNPGLGPERTREFEFGFDSSLFDSRLSLGFTYYDSRTYGALIPVLPTPSSGFSDAQVRNVGEIWSRGIELSVTAMLLRRESINWSAGLDLTVNDDEVVDMGGAARISLGYNNYIAEGYPPPSMFGRIVTNPNEFADPVFEEGFLGRVFPTTILGLRTNINLGSSITLSALGELSRGGHIVNATGFLNTIRGVWPACEEIQQRRDAQGIDALTAAERAQCIGGYSGYDQWVESGDFFKLRDVTAVYRLPELLLPPGAEAASLAVSGRNLLKITDYSGLDPEVTDPGASGVGLFQRHEYYTVPPFRSIVMKLNVMF